MHFTCSLTYVNSLPIRIFNATLEFFIYRKFVRRWFEQKTHWSLQLKVTCDDLPCRWFFCWFLKATYTLHQKAFYNETKQRLRWRLLEKAINFFVDFFFTSVLFVLFAYLSLSAHCHSNLSYQCLAIVFQKKFYHSFDQSDSKLERTATLSFVCDRIYGQVTELVSKWRGSFRI